MAALLFSSFHKRTGWCPAGLWVSVFQTNSECRMAAAPVLSLLPPNLGFGGSAPSVSSQFYPDVTCFGFTPSLPPAPLDMASLPLQNVTPLSSHLLPSLNIEPNSASCQVIWWQWWTFSCPMVLNFNKLFAIFYKYCILLKRISSWLNNVEVRLTRYMMLYSLQKTFRLIIFTVILIPDQGTK